MDTDCGRAAWRGARPLRILKLVAGPQHRSICRSAPLGLWGLGGLLLVAGVGCSVTETGNPSVALTAHTSERAAATLDEAGGALEVMEAWFSVESITFLPEGSCSDSAAVPDDLVGPFVFEAIRGELPIFDLGALDGLYCGVRIPELRVVAPLPAGAPPALEGATAYLRGERSDGVPVEIVDTTERLIVLTDVFEPAPIEISRRPQKRFLIAWDIATLVDGMDFYTATVAADGVIRISETENTALYAIFVAPSAEDIGVYPDLDGDGRLDDREFARRLGKSEP